MSRRQQRRATRSFQAGRCADDDDDCFSSSRPNRVRRRHGIRTVRLNISRKSYPHFPARLVPLALQPLYKRRRTPGRPFSSRLGPALPTRSLDVSLSLLAAFSSPSRSDLLGVRFEGRTDGSMRRRVRVGLTRLDFDDNLAGFIRDGIYSGPSLLVSSCTCRPSLSLQSASGVSFRDRSVDEKLSGRRSSSPCRRRPRPGLTSSVHQSLRARVSTRAAGG